MVQGKIITDDLGLSFELFENGGEVKGIDCIEVNARGLSKIASLVRTSLGPNGRDKIIVDQDGQITLTNDGRTIIENYISAEKSKSPAMILVKQLSESQDDEVGDGTTSIVLFASELLNNSVNLVKMGIHPIKVSEGLSKALAYTVDFIKNTMSEKVENEALREVCIKAAQTSLNSKIAANYSGIGELCTEAVFAIRGTDNSNDIDLEKIQIKTISGGGNDESFILNGIILEKEMVISPRMKEKLKTQEKCSIALLACPFEPPKLKNKGSLVVKTPEDYKKLSEYEKNCFYKMIEAVKNSGADMVLCQWGFDDEATSMLLEQDLPAVRWVPGSELGFLAAMLDGQILSRFEDLSPETLGHGRIECKSFGTENKKFIYITNSEIIDKVCTIAVRSANSFIGEEIERSIRDALFSIRNIIVNPSIVYGGGSLEIFLYTFLNNLQKDSIHIINLLAAEEYHCFKIFADALLAVPEALSKNSGHHSEYINNLITQSVEDKTYVLGVDCFDMNKSANMKEDGVFESFHGKTRQLGMAVDFVTDILKVSEGIEK